MTITATENTKSSNGLMHSLPLGISSFTYGWHVGVPGFYPVAPWGVAQLVEQAVAFGVPCLQIGDNVDLLGLSKEEHVINKHLMNANSLRVELGARALTDYHLEKYLDLCSFYEAPLLRFVVDGPAFEPALETIIATLKNVVLELEKRNVVLGIENHDRITALDFARIMESVGSESVGICLDCANSLGAGEGLEYVAGLLAPYTVNLHIKDFHIERVFHKMGFTVTGTIAGKGMLRLPWLLDKVMSYNRCQSAILEQWTVPELTIAETLHKELTWALQSMSYLRTIPELRLKETIL